MNTTSQIHSAPSLTGRAGGESSHLRLVFMGTPEFAVESLKKLVENQYNVVAVVTMPDKPVGRHHDTFRRHLSSSMRWSTAFLCCSRSA